MKLRYKLLIIVLILIVIIGVSMVIKAGNEPLNMLGSTFNCEYELAEYVKGLNNNEEQLKHFVYDPVQPSWVLDRTLKVHNVSDGGASCANNGKATIDLETAFCFDHHQSEGDNNTDRATIVGVLDIRWNPDSKQYNASYAMENYGGVAYQTGIVPDARFGQIAKGAYMAAREYANGKNSPPWALAMSRVLYNTFCKSNSANYNKIHTSFVQASGLSAAQEDSSQTYKDLIQYNSNGSLPTIEMIDTGKITEMTREGEYNLYGPFKINRNNGAYINEISITANVNGEQHTAYSNNGNIYYSTYYKDLNGVEEGIASNGWSSSISDIPSGVEFYICMHDASGIYNGKTSIKLYTQKECYDARILLSYAHAEGQNKLIYNAIPSADSVEYDGIEPKEITPSGTTLRVVKHLAEDESQKQTKVGFVVNKHGVGYLKYKNEDSSRIVKEGQMTYNESNFTWTSNRDEASIFETVNTGTEGVDIMTGYFQLNGIPTGKYYIGEVYNKNSGYESSTIAKCELERYDKDHTDSRNNRIDSQLITDIRSGENISGYTAHDIQVATINIENDGYVKVLRVCDSITNNADFNIRINKVDSSSKKGVSGAEFRIKVSDGTTQEKWLKATIQGNNEYTYSYTTSYQNATLWSTEVQTGVNSSNSEKIFASEKGVIYLRNLDKKYRYSICEFKPAENYLNLIAQASYGIDVTINNQNKTVKDITRIDSYTRYVNCGTVSYNSSIPTSNIEVTNIKSNQSGPSSNKKLQITGNIWLEKDLSGSHKNGTYNYLYDNGEEYNKRVTVSLMKMSDDENKEDEKIGSSVTTTNGSYTLNTSLIVNSNLSTTLEDYYIKFEYFNSYFIVETNYDNINGSKALGSKSGVACIYDLENYISNSSFYNNETLRHMNIGFIQMTVNQGIQATVYDVTANIKNQSYVYSYGHRQDGGFSSVDLGRKDYYCRIHKSDIVYSKQENVRDGDGLNVKIRYYIKITNNTGWRSTTTNQYNGMDIDDIKLEYSEDYKLTDNSKRTGWRTTTENGKTKVIIRNQGNLSKGASQDFTVEFELTDTAYRKILDNNGFSENPIVSFDGTHQYNVYEFDHWEYYYNKYGRRRRRAVKAWHRKTQEVDGNSPVSGMSFTLKEIDSGEKSRIIKGSVFEDLKIDSIYNDNGEVRGDGKLDTTKEGLLKDVKVEVLENKKDAEGNYILAKQYEYYKNKPTNVEKYKGEDASVITTYDDGTYGTYSFKDLIPRRVFN